MTDPSKPFWQRLLHRWFVEYNPLYPLSAALVLLGAHVIARGFLQEGELVAQLGVPGIAELYAWALIGGAALLTRIGQRRPAVMLALLAALYQCDLMLHTETCVYLGSVGWLAAGLWLVSFVAKIRALGWALELRISRSVVAVPACAAVGLVVVPRLLPIVGTSLLGAWVFGVLAAGLWTSRSMTPRGRLDGWRTTVLRRSRRAVWTMWAAACLGHAVFWCNNLGMSCAALVPVVLLLATRFVRREIAVWALVGGTLVFVAVAMPAELSLSALLGAAVLALRALRAPSWRVDPSGTPSYRNADHEHAPMRMSFGPMPREAIVRLLSGALFSIYLATWTRDWHGGAWPAHVVVLDAALALSAALVTWRFQLRAPLAGSTAVYLHYGASIGLIHAPVTSLGWGALAVTSGFALLLGSLAVSYRLHRLRPRDGEPLRVASPP
jgi:hypothetical protein